MELIFLMALVMTAIICGYIFFVKYCQKCGEKPLDK